jgi:hypothetical protein
MLSRCRPTRLMPFGPGEPGTAARSKSASWLAARCLPDDPQPPGSNSGGEPTAFRCDHDRGRTRAIESHPFRRDWNNDPGHPELRQDGEITVSNVCVASSIGAAKRRYRCHSLPVSIAPLRRIGRVSPCPTPANRGTGRHHRLRLSQLRQGLEATISPENDGDRVKEQPRDLAFRSPNTDSVSARSPRSRGRAGDRPHEGLSQKGVDVAVNRFLKGRRGPPNDACDHLVPSACTAQR